MHAFILSCNTFVEHQLCARLSGFYLYGVFQASQGIRPIMSPLGYSEGAGTEVNLTSGAWGTVLDMKEVRDAF